jgi:hypothetical protein
LSNKLIHRIKHYGLIVIAGGYKGIRLWGDMGEGGIGAVSARCFISYQDRPNALRLTGTAHEHQIRIRIATPFLGYDDPVSCKYFQGFNRFLSRPFFVFQPAVLIAYHHASE